MGLTELVIKDKELCKFPADKQNRRTSYEPVRAVPVGTPQVATYTRGHETKTSDLLEQLDIPKDANAYVCGNPTSIRNAEGNPIRTVEAVQFYRLI